MTHINSLLFPSIRVLPGRCGTMARRPFSAFLAAVALVVTAPHARAQILPEDTNHVVVFDRSGSMAGDRLELAKRASHVYRSSLTSTVLPPEYAINEQLALVSYSTTAEVNSDLTVLPAAGFDAAVDALQADGSTSIGAGLGAALKLLTDANSVPGPRECVVLVSDGQQNTDPAPAQFEMDYFSRVAKVHTVALGSDADEGLMSSIAASFAPAPGLYLRADDATELGRLELLGAFGKLANDCRDGGMAGQGVDVVAPGAITCSPVLVTGMSVVDFTAIYLGKSPPVVYLKPPYGGEIYPTTIGQNPSQLTFFDAQNFSRFSLEVEPGIDEGNWEFCAQNTSNDTLYMHSAASTAVDSVRLDVTPSSLRVGNAPLRVEAALSFDGVNVPGASLHAVIDGPAGVMSAVAFSDNGSAASGDRIANDGVYTVNIPSPASKGTYRVLVSADFVGNAFYPQFHREHEFSFYRDDTPACQALGPMSTPRIIALNGRACFYVDPPQYSPWWTPSQVHFQASPADGLPLNGISLGTGGGLSAAPLGTWSMQVTQPLPSKSSVLYFDLESAGPRSLQVQWYP